MEIIKAIKIKKSYGNIEVLKDISLNINKGEIVAITGASGAGKTTLLQVLGTLDQPDSGKIIINNIDILRELPILLILFVKLFS